MPAGYHHLGEVMAGREWIYWYIRADRPRKVLGYRTPVEVFAEAQASP